MEGVAGVEAGRTFPPIQCRGGHDDWIKGSCLYWVQALTANAIILTKDDSISSNPV